MNVYFIKCEDDNGYIKVGHTKDVDKRLETLQIGSPYTLKVIAVLPCTSNERAKDTEARIHRYFSHLRIRGEWFDSSLDISKLNDFYINT